MDPATRPVWAELGPPPRPRAALDGDVVADVAVVGLGASGLTAALLLGERGVTTVGVDAVAVGGGAAGANGGFLMRGGAKFYDDAVAVWGAETARLLWDATAFELDFLRARLGATVEETGRLRVAADDTEAVAIRAELRAMAEAGLDVEPYDGPAGVGLLVERDAACDPLRRVRALAAAAEDSGRVRLFEATRAASIAPGRVVCDTGVVRCEVVLVLVDGALAALGGARTRARSARLQMLATAPCAPLPALPAPVYRRYGFDYARQLPDGRVVVGGCRDRHEANEWDAPGLPTDAVQRDLDTLAVSFGAVEPVTHRWAATVSYREGALPWIGALDAGVYAAGAYNGVGNLVGAACARTLVARAVGEPGALDAVFAD